MNIFHSAALKLTAWYLSIIMILSISCSAVIYQFSSNELEQNTRRQVYFFNNQLDPSDFNDFAQLRQKQLSHGLNRLRLDFVLFNLFVLIGGGYLSYVLARRTLRPLEESLEAQKRFTSDASHELRTPLTAMQTEIEVALRDSGLTKTQATELLKSNLEEVGKLKALSEGLLHLAQTNSRQVATTPTSLSSVIKETLHRTDKAKKAKKITIKDKTKDLTLKADPHSLTELLVILVDNAIKYSPAGATVYLSSSVQGKLGHISVKDEGIGIKATDLPRIFERFYRAEASRSKTQTEGYGLGLAIAKKIADSLGGSITVKSAPDKGSTFTVSIPTYAPRQPKVKPS